MWWSIQKIKKSDSEIVYAYGYESDIPTGSFAVAKDLSYINVFEYAKNDDKELFTELFIQPLIGVLKREDFPEKYQFAIG